jgi:hypothetical protein
MLFDETAKLFDEGFGRNLKKQNLSYSELLNKTSELLE